MLSTAMFEAAHARIFDPLFTSCKIISTTVVVFPVPGGPCSKNTFFDDSAFEMASFLTPRKKKKREKRQRKRKQAE
jgi:hypothetical protein